MSALGNYIHYNLKNYLKYGTSVDDDSGESYSSYRDAAINLYKRGHATLLADMTTKARDAEAKRLETLLNQFYAPSNSSNVGDVVRDAVSEVAEKILEEQSNRAFDVDWSNLKLTGNKYNLDIAKAIKEAEGAASRIDTTSMRTAIGIRNRAMRLFYRVSKTLNGLQSGSEIESELLQIRSALEDLIIEGDAHSSEKTNLETSKQWAKSVRANGKTPAEELVEITQKLTLVAESYWAGKLTKWMVPVILQASAGVSKEALAKNFQEIVKANKNTDSYIKTEFLWKDSEYANNNFTFKTYAGSQRVTQRTRSKIDIETDWDGGVGEGKDALKLSIKNLGFYSDLHLVNGTPLYRVLLNMQNFGDLGTHYLNLNTEEEKGKTVRKADRGPHYKGQRKQLNRLVAEYAIQSAMRGYAQNHLAEFLVINRRKDDNDASSENKFYVYSIPSLIAKIISMPSATWSTEEVIQSSGFTSDFYVTNNFKPNTPNREKGTKKYSPNRLLAWERINDIIKQLNKVHLDVVIAKRILDLVKE